VTVCGIEPQPRRMRARTLFACVLSATAFAALRGGAATGGGRPAPRATVNGAAAASSSAAAPRLSDEGELARVSAQYEAGRYAECATSLEPLLGTGERRLTEPRVVENARLLRAACLIGAGRASEAEAPLAEALRADPRMSPPDALVYPQPVIDLWVRVREALREELGRAEAARLAEARAAAARRAEAEAARRRRQTALLALASEERVTRVNQRWIAAVPFGVGQFQNDDRALGWTLLGVQSALGAVSIGALAVHLSAYRQIATGARLEPEQTNSQLDTSYTVLAISSWSLLGVAALGVLHAQLTFVPEVTEVRRREIPRELRESARVAPSFAPSVVPLPQGAWIGAAGRF
jgi:hypothetical protein